MAKKKAAPQGSPEEQNNRANAGPRQSAPIREHPTDEVSGKTHSVAKENCLTISRNKHWRYISVFHGPWLQLPHEILETLAHSNYLSPRPRQTDPAVLFDLLKVRKLVDEAADLAVRAQNGMASSALGSENGLPGAALGLNTRGGGAHSRLSAERKYRMRELAVQKLSQAYRLDEVAACVATMQSTSALDTVASIVLQRNSKNFDAKYVHFFHEKIPSRMMAEYTPLDPLNEVIAFEPAHAAPFRTRAMVRIFKEDFQGATQDLSESLALCQAEHTQHTNAGKNQLVSLKTAQEEAERRRVWSRDWMAENKVAEEDQPRGIELQLLFQRGNQYLTMACQHLRWTLQAFANSKSTTSSVEASSVIGSADQENDNDNDSADTRLTSTDIEAYREAVEGREIVRRNAKRALRDFTSFLSRLDYAASPVHRGNGNVFDREGLMDSVLSRDRSIETDTETMVTHGQSHALARRRGHADGAKSPHSDGHDQEELVLHYVSDLLSASPPPDLPHFPYVAEMSAGNSAAGANWTTRWLEMVTYHPLLPETLHSLLLAHCLLQTAPTTTNRIACNVARLVRLADGYPFFMSARSPARADWTEILQKTDNWIGLQNTWDSLCDPDATELTPNGAAQGGDNIMQQHKKPSPPSTSGKQTPAEQTNHIHEQAVADPLEEKQVVNNKSSQDATTAREQHALPDLAQLDVPSAVATNGDINGHKANGSGASPNSDDKSPDAITKLAHQITSALGPLGEARKRSKAEPLGRGRSADVPVAKDEEYFLGTERAELIAQWILDAPSNIDTSILGVSKPRRKKRQGRKREEGAVSRPERMHTESSLVD